MFVVHTAKYEAYRNSIIRITPDFIIKQVIPV